MVLYFTGTGNSRYLARRIAEGLDMPLYDLNTCIKAGDTAPVQTGQDVVLVTPTYAWRIPRVVSQWLGNTELTGAERIWFVMDCGSEIGNAAKYNRQLAAQKHLRYMGTAQIIMPENYIAMFHAPQAEEARRIVEQAEPALQKALAQVRAGQEFSPLRDTLYDRFMSGPVNPAFYRFFVKADAFRATDACIVRQVRGAVPPEQYPAGKRQAGLGQTLHPLHGLHLRLPQRGHRVRQKEQRQAPVSL